MVYQAKRSKKYIEEFELVDEKGQVVHRMQVKLDAAELVKNVNGKYLNLVKALDKMQAFGTGQLTNDEAAESLDTLGGATVDMLEVVFGQENAKVIVDFYEGRYVEMAQEVFPFFTDVVVPKCGEIIKEKKEQIKARYNKKQRRLFGR